MEAVRDQVQKNTGDVLWVDISFAGGLIKRRVEIKIRDNGTGIPTEVKEKIREEVRRDPVTWAGRLRWRWRSGSQRTAIAVLIIAWQAC